MLPVFSVVVMAVTASLMAVVVVMGLGMAVAVGVGVAVPPMAVPMIVFMVMLVIVAVLVKFDFHGFLRGKKYLLASTDLSCMVQGHFYFKSMGKYADLSHGFQ